MSRLQPCPKCGAQFDVSAFAPGQKFTCGACGAVVTAGVAAPAAVAAAPTRAAAGRIPPAPSKTSSVTGASRGPQYVPVERRAAASAAEAPPKSRRARRGRDEEGEEAGDERGGRGRPAKKGLSPVALAGIGAGVLGLAGLLLLLNPGGDDKSKPGTSPTVGGGSGTGGGTDVATGGSGTSAMSTDSSGSTGPAAMGTEPSRQETLASVEAEWKQTSHKTTDQYRSFLRRYKALGPSGLDRAKAVAKEMLQLADAKDKEAHETLGHMEFAFEVPEQISFRKYPFCRAVEEAHAQRWFEDRESFDQAMAAYERCKKHAERLENDRVYRALDSARQEIDRDPFFRQYNYDATFASPYLICYATDERFDPDDLWNLSKKERAEKLQELDAKKKTYRKILAEKAKIYTQLYAEFMNRYKEECDLHDLMAEFGGRPDLPTSMKSFRDGCPLIVWIFSDKKAFTEYHDKVKQEGINPGVAGYFSPKTGWVYLYDEEGGNREFEINKNVHEGTHQLEHWFSRQKTGWGSMVDKDGRGRVPQSFFGEGFAEYTGSVTMAPDRKLTFVGYNRPRLESLQNLINSRKGAGGFTNVYPVKDLVQFEGYGNVVQWAGEHWGPFGFQAGLGIFYIQSWAFVYFLNEFQNHKYQPQFKAYLEDILNHPKNSPGYGFDKFKAEFKMNSEDAWKRMDGEFSDFYKKKLGNMKLEDIGKPPPSRDDWPGYQEPDPLAPDVAVKPQ
jgi:hypothetical protein